jgi:hypothetical protein
MLTTTERLDWDDAEASASDLTELHHIYMSSIRQHRHLLTELCKTLSKLGVAIDDSLLDSHKRDALSAGIGHHVDLALAIIADIDGALSLSALTRTGTSH